MVYEVSISALMPITSLKMGALPPWGVQWISEAAPIHMNRSHFPTKSFGRRVFKFSNPPSLLLPTGKILWEDIHHNIHGEPRWGPGTLGDELLILTFFLLPTFYSQGVVLI